jgi:hypothetical protein
VGGLRTRSGLGLKAVKVKKKSSCTRCENIPTSFKLIMSSEIRDNKVLSPQTLRLNKLASFDLGVFDKNRFFNGVQMMMMMIFIYVEETSRRA